MTTVDEGVAIAADIAYARRICTQGLARALRVGAKLSLANVAEAVDASEASVSRWEREKRGPSNPQVAANLGRLYRRLAR